MSIKCEERFFESTDRKDRVRYLTWVDDAVETKAVALIAHGVCEHIDRFHGLAEHLAKVGYAVYGEDHVGHGKTAMGEEQNLRNIGFALQVTLFLLHGDAGPVAHILIGAGQDIE